MGTASLLLLVAGALQVPSTHAPPLPAVGKEPALQPLAPERWLGHPVDEALAQLGPPTRILLIGDDLEPWRWLPSGAAERTTGGILSVHADRIVHIQHPEAFQPGSLPAEGAFLGQPVHELLERLGAPDAARTSAMDTHPMNRAPVTRCDTVLVYGDRWITLGRNRVLSMGPAVRPVISGPR